MPRRENISRDILEESERLRRQTVPVPCPAVQRVKSLNRVKAAAEFHVQSRALPFSDTAANGAIKALEQRLLSACEIDNMTIKGERWRSARPLRVAVPALEITPTPPPPMLQRQFVELPAASTLNRQR